MKFCKATRKVLLCNVLTAFCVLYPSEVKLSTEAVNPVFQGANIPLREVRDEDVAVDVMNSD